MRTCGKGVNPGVHARASINHSRWPIDMHIFMHMHLQPASAPSRSAHAHASTRREATQKAEMVDASGLNEGGQRPAHRDAVSARRRQMCGI